MIDRNSKEAIQKWVEESLAKSVENNRITAEESKKLMDIAKPMIAAGLWRGDISEKWMSLGYTTADIYDLYP